MKITDYYPYFEDYHEDVKKLARDASREIEKRAQEADENSNEQIVKENLLFLGELGFLGLDVPVEYGGQGLDSRSVVLFLEEVSRVCLSTAFSLAGHYLAVDSIKLSENESLKQKYLPKLSRSAIGAFALTEPQAGSDAASIITRAEKKDGYFVLRGEKHYITNGSIADIFVIFAKTSPEKGVRGITAFLVERDTPGLVIGKKENKLGVRASPTNQIFLDNVEVSNENIIGNVDDGFKIAMKVLTKGRINIAAEAVGLSKIAIQLAHNHASNRVQFGQPIINFQAIQFMLAEMSILLRASEELTYKAAWLIDKNHDASFDAAIAKFFSTESAKIIVDKALQIYGGLGYTKDHVIERLYRDVRVLTIAEGTSEIQKIIVYRNLKKVLEL